MPHGVGRPSAGYVRRGADSEPLTMRELQSMFFEARTRLERVEARRAEQSKLMQELWKKWQAGHLSRPSGDGPFAANLLGIMFRCTLTPLVRIDLDNFPDRFLSQDKPSPQGDIGEVARLVDLPQRTRSWTRSYRAVENVGNSENRKYWRASLEADGLVSQISLLAPWEPGSFPAQPPGLRIYPSWYARMIAQGMILMDWMRRWAGRPDIEYVLDGELINSGASVVTDQDWQESRRIPWSTFQLGPYSVGAPDGFQSTFDVIERELWDIFGLRRSSPLKFDMNSALALATP